MASSNPQKNSSRKGAPTMAAQELATSIISLYDVKSDTDKIIDELYASNATFRDPFVEVSGIDNVKAHFRSLSKFLASSKVTLNRGSFQGNCLTIDSNVVFTPKLLSILSVSVRMFIVCHISDGLIVEHADHWDIKSVIQSIPIVSFFYDKFRPLVGNVASIVIKRVWPSPVVQEENKLMKQE